jgi:hypothetical protein
MSDPLMVNRVADACRAVGHAECVLQLAGEHNDSSGLVDGAIYGAATILRAVIDQLQEIEIDLRKAG